VLQKCAKNVQVQNNPTLKWGTCHNGKYVATLNPKYQNNTLIKSGIDYGPFMSLLEGDGIPFALLYHTNATFASWAWRCENTSWLANVALIALAINISLVVLWTLKQTTQYNKYCIWNLKLVIQIKMSMALLEIYWPWIIFESWYCIRRLTSLRRNILFDADFQSCSIQVPLNAFAYSAQIAQITSVRSSLCFNLAYMLKGMAPTPHAFMPWSWRMWLEATITSVGLGTLGVYCKSPWSWSHSKIACLLALAIAFYSLW